MQEPIHNSGRTVAICDHPDAIEFILAGGAGPQRIDAWLALTPPAAQALAEQGIDYLVVDDFFEEADLLGNIDERIDFQAEWAVWVDRYLQARIPAFEQANFTPALAFFYQTKNFFDRIRVHRYSLEAFLSTYLPAKIIWVSCFTTGVEEPHAIDLPYVERILPALAGERNLELVVLKLPVEKTASFLKVIKNYSGPIKALLRKKAGEYWVRTGIQLQGWRLTGKNRNRPAQPQSPDRSRLIALQTTYTVNEVLIQLVAAGSRILYPSLDKLAASSGKINDPEIAASLHRVWQEIIQERDFWGLLEGWTRGKDIAELWLGRLWHRSFLEYWQGLQQSREYFKDHKADGVVVANILALQPYGAGAGFLQAARLAGIPIFAFLHGNLPGYCLHPFMALLDMPFTDYYFAHGPGAAKYLQQVAERYPFRHAITLAEGSPMIDGIRNSYSPKKAAALRRKLAGNEARPLVLHIPYFLYYHRRLCGDESSCMPSFDLQQRIIRLFSEFKNARLVYRNFAGQWPDLMPRLVHQQLPDAIVAGGDFKLSELVWAVDGIILDYPATPLAEVLLTDKPIIVLSDKRYFKMFEPAKDLLMKRARLTETPEDHLAAIREFLTRGDFEELSSPNNEFRRYYITDKDDGRAAAHVADSILERIAPRINGQSG